MYLWNLKFYLNGLTEGTAVVLRYFTAMEDVNMSVVTHISKIREMRGHSVQRIL